MIRRLKYNQIDFEKYTECLENSEQRKYSAAKDFLDITSNKQWEILVFNDYEAVMPVPYIRKLGLKFVVNPKLCQQLGIFSKVDNKILNDQFLSYFEAKYKIWYYAFNEYNTFSKKLQKRKNYLIFPSDYKLVKQNYSPKRKRKLRLDPDVIIDSEIKESSFRETEKFMSENFIGAKDEHDKKKFLEIFYHLEKANLLKCVVFIYQKKIINALAIYTDQSTIALLGTFNDKNYIKLSGSSVLIDHVISKNIQNKIFDFEGSEIPSIEEFFTGFRPVLKTYSSIGGTKKDLVRKFLNFK